MKNAKLWAFLVLLLIPSISLQAYWVWSPEEGKFVNPEGGAEQDTADEEYEIAMEHYRERNFKEAIEKLEVILSKYRNARIAPEAQYRLGTLFEEQQEYWKAFNAYKKLLESYPQSERVNEVIEREFKIGNLFLSGRKSKVMGLEILPSLSRATQIFQHIIDNAPYSDFGDQAQYHLGLTYKKMGNHAEALEAFQALIDNYPQSSLVADARFQLAETSFIRSDYTMRDQRALEDASERVDQFLERYPDSSASEKAAKIRQEIDEKNAEKNYRIGAYYEKTNYVASSLIYYRDVAERYPHTRWGQKSAQRLEALEDPAAYLKKEESKVSGKIQALSEQIAGVDKEDKFEKKRLERQMERLKKKEKAVQQNKHDSFQSRELDLKRRQSELQEKHKNLAKKKKLLEKNPSKDLKQAIDSWHASLQEEQDELDYEKKQLKEWKQSLGMPATRDWTAVIPFVGEGPTPVEKVKGMDAKKLYKVADEKKNLLEEKELLYKQFGEVAALLEDVGGRRGGMSQEEYDFTSAVAQGDDQIRLRQEKLLERNEEIRKLKGELKQRKTSYENRFGGSALRALVKAPVKVVTTSTKLMTQGLTKSISFLNPFDGSSKSLEDRDIQELNEMRMHLKEKFSAQRNLVDTLKGSLDQELAFQEQKRLLASLERDEETDVLQLRKTVKRLEKDIRSAYEEIGDRHDRQKELVKELEALLKQEQDQASVLTKTGRAVAAPFTFMAKGAGMFLFGRKSDSVAATEQVARLSGDAANSQQALELKEEIELQSLIIDAKNQEIFRLQKELEIAKAKASLVKGVKFRSSIVKVPYEFLGDAINSARQLIPKKDRREMLIDRLNDETEDLEEYKTELRAVEQALQTKSSKEPVALEVPEPVVEEPVSLEEVEQPFSEEKSREKQAALETEIRDIDRKIQEREARVERERAALQRELRALTSEAEGKQKDRDWGKVQKQLAGQEKKLRSELFDIEGELKDLIGKEGELEKQESEILEKRINHIDKVIQKVTSKAETQDLLRERDRLETRLMQLDHRRSFLAKELERFQMAETGTPN